MRRRRFGWQGLGVVLAFVTAASPLVATFHAAGVAHFPCPEDGELIDAGPAAHDALEVSFEMPFVAPDRGPTSREHSQLPHDHCAIAQQAFVRARISGTARVADGVTGTVALPRFVPEPPRLTSLAVYRLAPKASPPLA
ncbi:MAG TPA: hypothetical protein VG496_20445 [Myxococcales bacterium]|nr:hypothetical protein [Myxococcales bacterium]